MPLPSTDLAPDTRALADAFKAASVGDTVTHGALSAAIGRDVKIVRYLIPRALLVAQREAGAAFATLRGVGYRRLAATDAHLIGEHARQRIRGVAKRGAKAIHDVVSRANDMPPDAHRKALAEANALALLDHLSRDSAQPALPADTKPQPVAITARAFLVAMGAGVGQ